MSHAGLFTNIFYLLSFFMSFLYIIDILGTFSFAASGAFLAMEKRLDPFGVLVVAFVTAIGGGTFRDMLIGNMPVTWLKNETTVIVIIIAFVTSIFFNKHLTRFRFALFIFDALGLGLYTIIGIEMGIVKGFSPGICIAMGTISACFGGIIRDVLLNDVPLAFRKEIYALASVSGGLFYLLLKRTSLDPHISTIIAILVIVAFRTIAVRYKLSLPQLYSSKQKL